MTLIGNELFSILGENFCPAKSIVVGPCRIIPLEHDNIRIKAIDISLEDLSSEQQVRLVHNLIYDAINIEPKETFIAYRKNYKWVQIFANIKLKSKANITLGENSVFLLTGGLGGISLTLASHIVTHSKNPIFILMSRSRFPAKESWGQWIKDRGADDSISKKIQTLKAIEDKGGSIYFYQADISDETNLPSIINSIKQQFGAIHGVIHAAGNPGGGLAQFKTKEMASKVFEPKVYGTYLLCSLLKNEPLDFFVLCSSISSIVGEASQVDYCSANACLDAFPYSGLFQNSKTKISKASKTTYADWCIKYGFIFADKEIPDDWLV
jgi:NAD(P)-dependent dehydrogenase (short-subunit alcohol dehydrogenase family)